MGDLNTALAHAALAVSSGYCLSQCTDLKFARIGFCLYLANGAIGIVDYVMPKRNSKVTKALQIIGRVSKPSYLPLIAAEAFVFAGFEEKYAYCHLIFPVAYLILTELLKKNVDEQIVDLSTLCNSISVGYSGYTKDDLMYGGLTAVLNFVSFLATKYNSVEYLILIAVSNVFALQFFKKVW